MLGTFSCLGKFNSCRLCWLPGNPVVTTSLQDVTAPRQEINTTWTSALQTELFAVFILNSGHATREKQISPLSRMWNLSLTFPVVLQPTKIDCDKIVQPSVIANVLIQTAIKCLLFFALKPLLSWGRPRNASYRTFFAPGPQILV